MSKHFHFVLWMPLLFIVVFMSYWISIFTKSYTELEEYIMGKQVNYATDSALSVMLEYSDTSIDYADGDFILLEPEIGLWDFSWCLAVDYDYIPTETNLEYIQDNYIRTMVITTYDGMYGYYKQLSSSSDWKLVQTPKIPYFYTDESGRQYALTLDPLKGYQDNGDVHNYQMLKYNIYQNKPSNDKQQTAIVNDVADVVNWCLYRTYSGKNMTTKVKIPATADNVRKVNSMESPTIIAVIEGKEKTYGITPLAENVGGSSLEEAVHAVGFTFDGTGSLGLKGKYYATTTWWKKHESLMPGTETMKYFDTAIDAAKAGYNDISFFD